ncbi:MAG: methyltransferase domain-containing protein [Candidatus Eisenbacteria bacterium]|nr:methyltransferase domain-containing protein [Candidatus Eisenbacteria bacterium]
MATDYALMVRNLTDFYNVRDKTVITIGGGGGQLIGYAREASAVIAVDRDLPAIEQLQKAVRRERLTDRFAYVCTDFLAWTLPLRADVVLFEFCLHEMTDPHRALTQATRLAPDILVFDHGRDSPWSWHVAEEEKVAAAWDAVERFPIARRRAFSTEQRFERFDELLAKMGPHDAVAAARLEQYRGVEPIVIPMTYEVALLQSR